MEQLKVKLHNTKIKLKGEQMDKEKQTTTFVPEKDWDAAVFKLNNQLQDKYNSGIIAEGEYQGMYSIQFSSNDLSDIGIYNLDLNEDQLRLVNDLNEDGIDIEFFEQNDALGVLNFAELPPLEIADSIPQNLSANEQRRLLREALTRQMENEGISVSENNDLFSDRLAEQQNHLDFGSPRQIAINFEKRIEGMVKDLHDHDGELKENEYINADRMGIRYKEAYTRYKERYPEEEVISLARRVGEWTNEPTTAEKIATSRKDSEQLKEKTVTSSETEISTDNSIQDEVNQNQPKVNDSNGTDLRESQSQVNNKEKDGQPLSQDLQQLRELQNKYSSLELKFQVVLDELKDLKQSNNIPDKVIEASEDVTRSKIDVKDSFDKVVQQVKNAIKQKTKAAIKVSLQAIKFDVLLSNLSRGLKKLEAGVSNLEKTIESLNVAETISKNDNAEKNPKGVDEKVVKDSVEDTPKPRVKIGERRAEAEEKPKKSNTVIKNEPVIEEPISEPTPDENFFESSLFQQMPEDAVTEEAQVNNEPEQQTEVQDSATLPEDFRAVLESTSIPIDAAHKSSDENGNPTYTYRANHKVDVPGVPLEAIEGLSSIAVANLLQKDVIDRMMDGRLSVDSVFSEEQKSALISNYVKSKKQPNAFESRLNKANKQKATNKFKNQSQEQVQAKHVMR
ncbi:hypothetical protein BW154_06930 [Lactococcus lactis]|uniref:Uncharacterized protein n=2 Tax=Lactococcus lactis TaxID=1358 RepID=A0AAP8E1K7_9LACT|nr:hypothetical protein BW154_06930 [Lactococcus lactis]